MSPTPQAIQRWHDQRRSLRRWFWIYLSLSAIGVILFVRDFPPRDPYWFALLLLIPLTGLRQAWRMDRQIVAVDRHLRENKPIIESMHKAQGEIMTEKATFAAGCFWGVEEMFRKVPGVLKTRVGYIAGKIEHPTYEQVCTNRSGHAEAIEVEFDPAQVTFQQLLELFFENHDPTTLNRQGPDVGTQYRSGVYFHSPEQQHAAETEIEKRDASGDYSNEIVTEVVPATTFWAAEDYHQRYFEKRNADWSCHFGNGKKPGRQRAAH